MPYNDTRPSAALVRRAGYGWSGSGRADRIAGHAVRRYPGILALDRRGPVGTCSCRF